MPLPEDIQAEAARLAAAFTAVAWRSLGRSDR